MLFPTQHRPVHVRLTRSSAGGEVSVAPSRWGRSAVAVARELVPVDDPAKRETRWRIGLLTLAVFAALC